MPRSGPRPHVWKVQGEIAHQQYCCWLKMKAQADFRGESWSLPFTDYQTAWQGHWHLKGRDRMGYCLTRIDCDQPWQLANVECITRSEHFRRSADAKRQKRKNHA